MNKIENLGISVDIETLGRKPTTIVTQVAIVAFDLADPDTVLHRYVQHLPLNPQAEMGRSIDPETVIWWITETSAAARNQFANNTGGDVEEVKSLMRAIARTLNQWISNAETYEIWARGPQFDIVILENLFQQLGIDVPWHYQSIRDLRTLMKLAEISPADVPMEAGMTPHSAIGDAEFQVACYSAARKRIQLA